MPEFLTLGDVLEFHTQQVEQYGGSDGIRDVGLLESAIAQPEAKFGGEFLHADLFEMAAAYLFHLVKNHPFIDGNKRVGLETALVFLEINGHSIDASDEELVELVLQTVVGKLSKPQIAEFFRSGAE
jgi:death-on-curing protein